MITQRGREGEGEGGREREGERENELRMSTAMSTPHTPVPSKYHCPLKEPFSLEKC